MSALLQRLFASDAAEAATDSAKTHAQAAVNEVVTHGMGVVGQLKENTTAVYVLAVAAVVFGLVMCFAGKRYFRLCIGIIGGIVGGVVGVMALKAAAHFDHTVEKEVAAGIVGGCALITGILLVSVWRWGLLVAGGFAGYSIATYVLSTAGLKAALGSYATAFAVVAAIVIGVVLMRIFETVVSIVATSAGGSMLTFLGADCFVGSHFARSVYEIALGHADADGERSETEIYMFAGTAALAVCGFVVQVLSALPSRKH